MIDDAVIKGVTEIANARLKNDYTGYGEHHFAECEVKTVCEAFLELAIEIIRCK